jgi:hypothetical protein
MADKIKIVIQYCVRSVEVDLLFPDRTPEPKGCPHKSTPLTIETML